MKPQEGVYPAMASASRDAIEEEDRTEDVEVPTDWVEPVESEEITSPVRSGAEVEGTSGEPGADLSARRVINSLKTAEINVARDRRTTLTSPIPALLAESMMREPAKPAAGGGAAPGGVAADRGGAVARDPAAPEPEKGEQTRRLGDSDQHLDGDASAGYTVELVDDGNAERRKRAASLIDRARACYETGDLPGAAQAAESALDEADQAAPPGIVEVIEPARPLLARVFAAFVGPLGEVPVLGRRFEEIAAMALDERRRAVVARVDGVRTLDQVLDGAHIPAADALRVAASLLQAGIIRVV
jgi:hypothetical protein